MRIHQIGMAVSGSVGEERRYLGGYLDAAALPDGGLEENDSTCFECNGGGQLLCCDGCVKAYHRECLSSYHCPSIDSDTDWFCPTCVRTRFTASSSSSAAPGLPTSSPPLSSSHPPQSSHPKELATPTPPPSPPPRGVVAIAAKRLGDCVVGCGSVGGHAKGDGNMDVDDSTLEDACRSNIDTEECVSMFGGVLRDSGKGEEGGSCVVSNTNRRDEGREVDAGEVLLNDGDEREGGVCVSVAEVNGVEEEMIEVQEDRRRYSGGGGEAGSVNDDVGGGISVLEGRVDDVAAVNDDVGGGDEGVEFEGSGESRCVKSGIEISEEVISEETVEEVYNAVGGGSVSMTSQTKVSLTGRFTRPRAAILQRRNDKGSRSPSPAPAAVTELGRKRKKRTSEGSKYVNKINIGPGHQIPGLPVFFLNRDESDEPWNAEYENARLVFSPNLMDRIRQRRVAEGHGDNVVKTEMELSLYLQKCAKNWKNQPGWQPFSPEFAYKMLHHAEYDPGRALRMMNDPHFCFNTVCDPPNRKYENKWKPKDKRGQLGTSPYPPPLTLRGYLSRRQHVSGYMLR
eukprot:GHVQ01042366.1.p1 GENE.GHVQ01042366.1~~GHVQ01042366.1.p1  ORF type:complete len:568 (+),score=133.32 GHVQ01042366.1:676-2379(+)